MFHGPSGAGKDTQIDLLEEYMDFEKIATGDMFRGLPGEGHELAMKVEKDIKNGMWPHGRVTYALLEDWVKRFDKEKDWMLVSIVRLENQIEYYEKFMKNSGRTLDAFVHFSLPDEVAVERLSVRTYCPVDNTPYHPEFKKEKNPGFCDLDGTKLIQRDDDKPDAIRKRLQQYRDNITPILDYFREKGTLIEIDGSPSIEEIHSEVVEKLDLTKKQ